MPPRWDQFFHQHIKGKAANPVGLHDAAIEEQQHQRATAAHAINPVRNAAFEGGLAAGAPLPRRESDWRLAFHETGLFGRRQLIETGADENHEVRQHAEEVALRDVVADKQRLEDEKKRRREASSGKPGVRGTILVVNQAYNFVVLNLGGRQGVEPNSEMIVLRDGIMIGKIRVSSVEPSSAIGDIIVSSLGRGVQVQPGDIVIYAGTNS